MSNDKAGVSFDYYGVRLKKLIITNNRPTYEQYKQLKDIGLLLEAKPWGFGEVEHGSVSEVFMVGILADEADRVLNKGPNSPVEVNSVHFPISLPFKHFI